MANDIGLHVAFPDGTSRRMTDGEYDGLMAGLQAHLDAQAIHTFSLEWLNGWCPVQAEGKVNDKPFYFRARWDAWRFEVDGRVYAQGDYPVASWMPLGIAIQCIGIGVVQYAQSIGTEART